MQNANSLSGLSSLDARTIPLRTIKFYRYLRTTGTTASFLLFLLTTLMAFPFAPKSSNIAEAAPAPVESETTIAMVVDKSSANLNLTPKDPTGSFASSSIDESASFNITTNNYTGYTLSISGSSDDGQLTSDATGTSFNSIDSVISETTFDSTVYNGKWGYVPSKYNSTENTSFRPAPTTSASTLDVTERANSESNNYTIGLGARADMTTSAGTYTNTFVLTAVGNPINYQITYSNDTGDSSVANLPSFDGDSNNHTQIGSATSQTIPLSNTIPTRTNYTFKSWCLGSTSNNGTTCTGTEYSAAGNFGIDQTTANVSVLNAVWNPNITIKTSTGISTTTLNGTSTTTTSGTTVTGLINGQSYTLTATTSTGYSFSSWPTLATNGGTISSSSTSGSTTTATYTVGSVPITITPTSKANTYTITLNKNGATNTPTGSTTATYNSTTLGTIATLPVREYSYTGFTMGTNASGLSPVFTNASSNCKSASSCKNSYTFNGWYKESGATNKIASSASTPALSASTSYTNASSQWTSTSNRTLYAGWGSGTSITLPTISKTGYTCGWGTSSTATTYTYTSGGTYTPTANQALYGICTVNSYKQTVQVRYQNADGTYGSYSDYAACTKDVNYGSTHSCSIAATTEYQAASLASYTVTGTATKQITVDRNTFTITLNKGTGIAGVSGAGTYRYGQSATINASLSSGYEWVNWTGSSTITSKSYTFTVTANRTWKANGKLSMRAIQDITSSTCTTTAQTVYDNRDNQQYIIQKLADGKCWMMTNLNLTAPTVDLTSSNTNLSNTVTQATFTGWKKTSGSGTYTAGEFIPVSGTDSTSGTAYGTLYNYCAASAGTICTSSDSDSATYDICPKGWRLPTGGSSGEFQALYNNSSYNSYAKMRAPISQGGAAFTLAGSFNFGTPYDQGSLGSYWSSTRYDSTGMCLLFLNTSNVYPAGLSNRLSGFSIRCVLK